VKCSDFAATILNWYALNARDLPWRGHTSSYAVWVSEIMLQQTRVETVVPYFERWMARFPTISLLAQSSQQDVLSTWEGLGYYSRARNLHRAAQIVMQEMGGELPADTKALRRLPGIGRYTAGAIASIAFGRDEPALDANIRRVLSRVFNMGEPAHSPAGERRLWELAWMHLPSGAASAYNQALMDLGSGTCTPRAPDCPHCPVAGMCLARELGIQEQRPVLRARAAIPHYIVTAAVITRGDRVLITQRPANGLLGGLWEFPGGKLQEDEDLIACLQREIREELGMAIDVGGSLGIYKHAYTHFRVTLHAFSCMVLNGAQPQLLHASDLRWAKLTELSNFPMGKIDRQIARQIANQSISSPLIHEVQGC